MRGRLDIGRQVALARLLTDLEEDLEHLLELTEARQHAKIRQKNATRRLRQDGLLDGLKRQSFSQQDVEMTGAMMPTRDKLAEESAGIIETMKDKIIDYVLN